jgi:C-22 sterol desaturase
LVQLSNVQLPDILSSASKVATWTNTTLAIVLTLLIIEQSVYRRKKKHLPGDSWTIPIIGKFADSTKPTMEAYMKQWNAGALSALSVFNMSASFASALVGTLTFNRCSSALLSWRLARNIRAKFSTRLRMQNPVSCIRLSRSYARKIGRDSYSYQLTIQVNVSPYRVFLTGKDHVSYRRVLNNLFTHKSLG